MTANRVPTREASLLAGVRVLAFTHWLQGPAACQYLADLGADVIKVEPLSGSAERAVMGPGPGPADASSLFVAGNRNTRSLCIDLKSKHGAQLVHRLVRTHDVVIENYRPGVLDKLGLGYEQLKLENESLIFASATGYGPRGPLASMPGQDLLAQSVSGLTAASGARPTPVGAAVVDQHGATLLALSVLAAVVRRSHTGEGTKIEASLLNAALDLQMEALTFFMNSDAKWSSVGKRHENLATWYHQAPYGVYETLDGWLTVSMGPLETLCAALPEVGDLTGLDPMRDRDEVTRRVTSALTVLSSDEAQARLRAAGVWHAPVLDYDEVLASEQVETNGIIGAVGDDDWRASVIHHPVMYDGALPAVRTPPPHCGQHTREILRESGLDDDELEALISKGVVQEGKTR
ncbi:CoA transferase [Mycobacterium sp. 21AC1]|uniref:CaiB/BaiF CoA transferase family protein n=1 Tax=[Mycobacterium] appelbergii TaxID=2939269 RepID=UPI0029393AD8|nr:CaiB/BaiF CoA-transferase family protein [Mycobacterium sp. 21AC1]MDV3127234.1 CoA transferase [Mycobacterium sp. 21AC1]